jgi:hypothetical protein
MKVFSSFSFFISFMLHRVISAEKSRMPLSFISPKKIDSRSPYRGKYSHIIRPLFTRKISASSHSYENSP